MTLTLANLPALAYSLPEDVLSLKYNGDFETEIERIDSLLKRPLPEPLAERLRVERLLAEGMMDDYSLSFEEGLAKLQSRVKGMTAEELRELMGQGVIDWRLRHGKVAFVNTFCSSLLINTPSLRARLKNASERQSWLNQSNWREENMRIMKERGYRAYRFRIRHEVMPDEETFRPGEEQLVHIPLPVKHRCQKHFKLLDTSSEPVVCRDGAQATASFRWAPQTRMPCFVEYSYECQVDYQNFSEMTMDVYGGKADHCDLPRQCLGEEYPHIRFTPYLRALAAHLQGEEREPLRIAWKFYHFITTQVRYAYMRDYLLIENIPEYAALNLRGDCGVQGLLFITLCRIAGIPAQWQSGFTLTTTSVGSHDWTQFYVKPYGWLFCDPSIGGGALREGHMEQHRFYFGNADCFRMTSCNAFQRDFTPARQYMRIDPYDNQCGEIEYADGPVTSTHLCRKRTMVDAEEII